MVPEENLTSAFRLMVVVALTFPLLTVLTLAANVTPLVLVLLTRKAVVPALPPNAVHIGVAAIVCKRHKVVRAVDAVERPDNDVRTGGRDGAFIPVARCAP